MRTAMDTTHLRSVSSDACRRRAMLQHQRLRFVAADVRRGRHLDYDTLAKDDERVNVQSRIGELEERCSRVEVHLFRLLHEIDSGSIFGRSFDSPWGHCASAELATDEPVGERSPNAAEHGWEVECRRTICQASKTADRCHSLLNSVANPPPLEHRGSGRSIRNRVVAARALESSAVQNSQQGNSADSQKELREMKVMVDTMQSALNEYQKSVFAEKEFTSDVEQLRDRISQLESSQTLVGSSAAEQLVALEKLHPVFERRLAELENNRHMVDSEMKKSGRALVGVTSDMDMLEARVKSQLAALETNLERQGRALQGHIATTSARSK